MKVQETARTYRFDNGAVLTLHNVSEIEVSPSAHRVVCDEGYVLVERAHILYTTVPTEARAF